MKRFLLVAVVLMAVPAVCEADCGPSDDVLKVTPGQSVDVEVPAHCHFMDYVHVEITVKPVSAGGELEIAWRQDSEGDAYTELGIISVNSSGQVELDGVAQGAAWETVTIMFHDLQIVNQKVPNLFRVTIDRVQSGADWTKMVYLAELGSKFSDLTGDLNGSGKVDQADLDLVLLHWGESSATRPFEWLRYQPPNGFLVDQEELDWVLNNWGATCP